MPSSGLMVGMPMMAKMIVETINRVSPSPTITATTESEMGMDMYGGIVVKNNPMLQKLLGTVIRGTKARITKYIHDRDRYSNGNPDFMTA